MRKSIGILFIIFSCFASCSEDDIAPIQKHCKEITSNISTYKTKTIDLTGLTDQSGAIIGYFKDKDLMMANVTTTTDSGRTSDTYYFDDEKICCAQMEVYSFNKPTFYTQEVAAKNGDSVYYDDKKTVRKVSYFYFYEKRLIKWINQDNQVVPDNDRKFQYQRGCLLNDAEKLVKMLKEQNS